MQPMVSTIGVLDVITVDDNGAASFAVDRIFAIGTSSVVGFKSV